MKNFCLFVLLFSINTMVAQQSLAYLSNSSGNFDLFLSDEQGTTTRQMTKNPGWDWAPQWNDKLQAVLYNSSDTANQFSIRMINLKGEVEAVNTQGLEEFILSPSGKFALYTLKDNQHRYIGIMDVELGEHRLLVNHPSNNSRASWSPDEQYFSFISDRDGNGEIYIYQLATGLETRLTNSEKREKYTSWSPEGAHIFYTYHYSDERDREHNDIFSVNIYDKTIKQITNDRAFYQEIAVSPDGQKIAFHAKRNGQDHIYTIGIDGKNEKQITSVKAYHGEPCWVPQSFK